MILPINLKPYAKTYQHWASPIAAMTAMKKESEIFIVNKLTHIFYVEEPETLNFCDVVFFNKWDCLDADKIIAGSINSRNELEELFLKKLDAGFYIYTYVNEKYIPRRKSYLQFDFGHDILVHGYDEDFFTVLGYCDDGLYRSTTVPRKDFIAALYDDSGIDFFKLRDHYEYKLDVKKNMELITKYLLCEAGYYMFVEDYSGEVFYGIGAFYKMLQKISETDIIRQYDFFYEHKRLMYDRLCFFSQLMPVEAIKAEYQKILDSASIVRSLALKFSIVSGNGKDGASIKDKIIIKGRDLLAKEKQLLEEFLAIAEKTLS
jgi:hypothetical protein